MRKYLAEAIGTFVLLFAGCGSIIISDLYPNTITHGGISMAFGTAVLVMIYAVGNVSGAHFNPAVTIGFCFAKKMDKKEALMYILFQLIGAILSMILINYLFEPVSVFGVTVPSVSVFKAFLIEILLTFILMTVILNVSTGYKEKGIMAGVAVGTTVFILALIGGPLTGASMNPARTIAPALIAFDFSHIWLYIVGPIIGAILASPMCKLVQGENCCEGESC